MARKRMLDPSIWEDEDTGRLSPEAFKVFIACISNADDDGKLIGSAATIRGIAFRHSDNIRVEDVEGFLQELAATLRSFLRYQVDGRVYIKLLNWETYQTIRKPYPSRIPEPETGTSDAPVRNQCVTVPDMNRSTMEVQVQEKGSTYMSVSEEEKPSKADRKAEVDALFSYYKEKIQPAARLCPSEKIANRLKKFSADELRTAIDHFAGDTWWMENNASRGGEWFFASDGRIEQLLLLDPNQRKDGKNGRTYANSQPRTPGAFAKYG